MNIGFFADDSSASHAALLANSAFGHADASRSRTLAGGYNIVDAIPSYLEGAVAARHHLMVALPLAQLGNVSLRSRLDLAVISFGSEPLAHEGARRAMASKAAQPTDAMAPPWMLACCGRALPEAPRALPIRIGALRRTDAARLRAGCTCGSLYRRAVGLAATLRIAADDPYATRLDRTRVIEAMAAGETAAEIRLRHDLLDLVEGLDEHIDADADVTTDRRRLAGRSRRSTRRGSGRPLRQGRTPRFASFLPTSRHSADCACSDLA